MENDAVEKEKDYLRVLDALAEMPFGVGKGLLADFLAGEEQKRILKHNFQHKKWFGIFKKYSKEEINELIEQATLNQLVDIENLSGKEFVKVLKLSDKGRIERANPQLYKRRVAYKYEEAKDEITKEEIEKFQALGNILEGFNDLQKKAIIQPEKRILCIAGAGSGKTKVLTKRIEFLVKYASVPPENVLAITFTRKAKHEMEQRLEKIGGLEKVKAATFNSFCEEILRKSGHLLYDLQVKVLSYSDKIRLVQNALNKIGMNISSAVQSYFSASQQRGREEDKLAAVFLNDCFFLRDYFAFKGRKIDESSFIDTTGKHEIAAGIMLHVCKYLDEQMKKEGLRDFADQLLDCIHLFETRKDLIPKFSHILIDEYQDVNATQMKLVDLLSPSLLFCVGDPRQSIYGWRGSDISYILQFKEKYPGGTIISLKKNYRSGEKIVKVINSCIKKLGLQDLESANSENGEVHLLPFDSEDAEYAFVTEWIAQQKGLSLEEIFVLARTNKQLERIKEFLSRKKIAHLIKKEDSNNNSESEEIYKNKVLLATVHASKGLEAKTVFVVGCTGIYFPCKGSEHPVIEMVKVDEYDKEEEERRLLYVALSRAKERLFITYTGKKPTHFINEEMISLIENNNPEKENEKSIAIDEQLLAKLKDWRRKKSHELQLSAFIVMTNRTAEEIALKKPTTSSALQKIYGMGASRVERYGKEILEIIDPLNISLPVEKIVEKKQWKWSLDELKKAGLPEEELNKILLAKDILRKYSLLEE